MFLHDARDRLVRLLGYTPSPAGRFWEKDKIFMALYQSIKDHTVVSIDRCYMLFQLAQMAPDGSIAELGVYKGGTAKLIHTILPESNYYLFDTFSGLPPEILNEKEKESASKVDFQDTSLEEVKTYLGCKKFIFKQGFFPDTTEGMDEKFAFVYLDADLYQSTKDGLEYFYDKMVPNGIIVVDDYGSNYWDGVTKAVDEFRQSHNVRFLRTTKSQCVLFTLKQDQR